MASVQVKEEALSEVLSEALAWEMQAPGMEEVLLDSLAKDLPVRFRAVGEPALLEAVPSPLAPSVAPWVAAVQVKEEALSEVLGEALAWAMQALVTEEVLADTPAKELPVNF